MMKVFLLQVLSVIALSGYTTSLPQLSLSERIHGDLCQSLKGRRFYLEEGASAIIHVKNLTFVPADNIGRIRSGHGFPARPSRYRRSGDYLFQPNIDEISGDHRKTDSESSSTEQVPKQDEHRQFLDGGLFLADGAPPARSTPLSLSAPIQYVKNIQSYLPQSRLGTSSAEGWKINKSWRLNKLQDLDDKSEEGTDPIFNILSRFYESENSKDNTEDSTESLLNKFSDLRDTKNTGNKIEKKVESVLNTISSFYESENSNDKPEYSIESVLNTLSDLREAKNSGDKTEKKVESVLNTGSSFYELENGNSKTENAAEGVLNSSFKLNNILLKNEKAGLVHEKKKKENKTYDSKQENNFGKEKYETNTPLVQNSNEEKTSTNENSSYGVKRENMTPSGNQHEYSHLDDSEKDKHHKEGEEEFSDNNDSPHDEDITSVPFVRLLPFPDVFSGSEASTESMRPERRDNEYVDDNKITKGHKMNQTVVDSSTTKTNSNTDIKVEESVDSREISKKDTLKQTVANSGTINIYSDAETSSRLPDTYLGKKYITFFSLKDGIELSPISGENLRGDLERSEKRLNEPSSASDKRVNKIDLDVDTSAKESKEEWEDINILPQQSTFRSMLYPFAASITNEKADTRNIPRYSTVFQEKNEAKADVPKSSCWVDLLACHQCHLEFEFVNINLPSCSTDEQCRCDYVKLSEPPYVMQSSREFCIEGHGGGTLFSDTVTNRATIDFVYSSEHLNAFSLKVTARENIYRVVVSHNDGLQSIETPFFPELYPKEYRATFEFEADDKEGLIRISFLDFQLSPWSYIEVHDTNRSRIAVFNGYIFRPPILMSSGPLLTMKFTSNGQTAPGFRMQYEHVRPGSGKILPTRTDCGGYVGNSGGVITMMNMTSENSSVSYDCIWLIQPPKQYTFRTHISVRLAQFDFMGPGSTLSIFQGTTSKGYLLERRSSGSPEFPSERAASPPATSHVVSLDIGFYISLRGVFDSRSTLAIVYTSFSYLRNCYSLKEHLCLNQRCIPKSLTCDGFDHCGDGSDEPPSCYSGANRAQDFDTKLPGAQDHISPAWWIDHAPNYYFTGQKPTFFSAEQLSTGIGFFLLMIVSLLGFGSFAFCVLKNNMAVAAEAPRRSSRRPHNRGERQQRGRLASNNTDSEMVSHTVSPIPPDDPPEYEEPPNYEDFIKTLFSGRKHKLVQRPEGITAWVPETPPEIHQNGTTDLPGDLSTENESDLQEPIRPEGMRRHGSLDSMLPMRGKIFVGSEQSRRGSATIVQMPILEQSSVPSTEPFHLSSPVIKFTPLERVEDIVVCQSPIMESEHDDGPSTSTEDKVDISTASGFTSSVKFVDATDSRLGEVKNKEDSVEDCDVPLLYNDKVINSSVTLRALPKTSKAKRKRLRRICKGEQQGILEEPTVREKIFVSTTYYGERQKAQKTNADTTIGANVIIHPALFRRESLDRRSVIERIHAAREVFEKMSSRGDGNICKSKVCEPVQESCSFSKGDTFEIDMPLSGEEVMETKDEIKGVVDGDLSKHGKKQITSDSNPHSTDAEEKDTFFDASKNERKNNGINIGTFNLAPLEENFVNKTVFCAEKSNFIDSGPHSNAVNLYLGEAEDGKDDHTTVNVEQTFSISKTSDDLKVPRYFDDLKNSEYYRMKLDEINQARNLKKSRPLNRDDTTEEFIADGIFDDIKEVEVNTKREATGKQTILNFDTCNFQKVSMPDYRIFGVHSVDSEDSGSCPSVPYIPFKNHSVDVDSVEETTRYAGTIEGHLDKDAYNTDHSKADPLAGNERDSFCTDSTGATASAEVVCTNYNSSTLYECNAEYLRTNTDFSESNMAISRANVALTESKEPFSEDDAVISKRNTMFVESDTSFRENNAVYSKDNTDFLESNTDFHKNSTEYYGNNMRFPKNNTDFSRSDKTSYGNNTNFPESNAAFSDNTTVFLKGNQTTSDTSAFSNDNDSEYLKCNVQPCSDDLVPSPMTGAIPKVYKKHKKCVKTKDCRSRNIRKTDKDNKIEDKDSERRVEHTLFVDMGKPRSTKV